MAQIIPWPVIVRRRTVRPDVLDLDKQFRFEVGHNLSQPCESGVIQGADVPHRSKTENFIRAIFGH